MFWLLGRIASSIENIAKEVQADHYFISGNGAFVYDMQKDEILYENYMNKEEILKLVQICDENSIYYNIYTEEEVITKSLNYNVLFYNYENSKKSNNKKTAINVVEGVYQYIKESNKERFLKMTVCDKDKVIFNGIVRKLRKIQNVDVLDVAHMSRKMIKSGTQKILVDYFYTEITKKNTDKWDALQEILQEKQIKPEEVIAIGDNMNDKKMVEKAGMGVAMGQSTPVLTEIADLITKDNNENGVAHAINQLIG